MANGHGGARPNTGGHREGAGRKPKQITEIRGMAIADALDHAKYALALFVDFMQNESLDRRFRSECAREVMDRVWGKPLQHNENTGDTTLTVRYDRTNDTSTETT